MRPDLQDFDLSNEGVLAEVIKVLVSHNLVWLSHASEPVGHIYPGKGAVTPELLYPFILRNPKLKIILAHWGGGLPFYALMPEVKTAINNVFFDTAASPYLYQPGVYGQVLDILGETNILFGSDYPLMSPGRVIKEIIQAGLSEKSKTAVLGGNARRAFNLS
jgi:predicted TIM-barrel fold metal-dependent hydrolase